MGKWAGNKHNGDEESGGRGDCSEGEVSRLWNQVDGGQKMEAAVVTVSNVMTLFLF